jgi:Holliday junction resolvase RusA-like endonuclease
MIEIKPLSVNKAWKGRRYKSDAYKAYEKELMLKLPRLKVPDGKLRIDITFHFKNSLSDIDNPLKQFLDILQKKYGFNDRDIYELNVKKELGCNGIEFNIYRL